MVVGDDGSIMGFAEGQCGNWESIGLEAAGAVYAQTAGEQCANA